MSDMEQTVTPKNSATLSQLPRVTIMGVGNPLLKDEGAGSHAINALRQLDLPQDIELIDAGTTPELINYSKNAEKLIIIDAVKAGGQPGTIYYLRPDELGAKTEKVIASVHRLGLEQSLKLMRLAKNTPKEIVIIGIEPGAIDWGTALSDEVGQKMPELVKAVLNEIDSIKPKVETTKCSR